MDATAYENSNYGYVIEQRAESRANLAAPGDELYVIVDPLSGEVRFEYAPVASGSSDAETFWESATAKYFDEFGIILGESQAAEGARFFSVTLSAVEDDSGRRPIRIFVSKAQGDGRPSPDDEEHIGKPK